MILFTGQPPYCNVGDGKRQDLTSLREILAMIYRFKILDASRFHACACCLGRQAWNLTRGGLKRLASKPTNQSRRPRHRLGAACVSITLLDPEQILTSRHRSGLLQYAALIQGSLTSMSRISLTRFGGAVQITGTTSFGDKEHVHHSSSFRRSTTPHRSNGLCGKCCSSANRGGRFCDCNHSARSSGPTSNGDFKNYLRKNFTKRGSNYNWRGKNIQSWRRI